VEDIVRIIFEKIDSEWFRACGITMTRVAR
jgi:hypothetical protein